MPTIEYYTLLTMISLMTTVWQGTTNFFVIVLGHHHTNFARLLL